MTYFNILTNAFHRVHFAGYCSGSCNACTNDLSFVVMIESLPYVLLIFVDIDVNDTIKSASQGNLRPEIDIDMSNVFIPTSSSYPRYSKYGFEYCLF